MKIEEKTSAPSLYLSVLHFVLVLWFWKFLTGEDFACYAFVPLYDLKHTVQATLWL